MDTSASPAPWRHGWRLLDIVDSKGRLIATLPTSEHPVSEARAHANAKLIIKLRNANTTALAQARRDSIEHAADLENEAQKARDFARSLTTEPDK